MDTSYSALNGKEIRQLVKQTLNREIDNLPLLKEANTFHKAVVSFGFTMEAYPTDVTCPQKEFEFEISDPSLDLTFWKNHSNNIEELKSARERLVSKGQTLAETIAKIDLALDEVAPQVEVLETLNGANPDKARIEGDLPINVIKTEGGKRMEVQVPASSLSLRNLASRTVTK